MRRLLERLGFFGKTDGTKSRDIAEGETKRYSYPERLS
jgi:hypothetical protein